jgi:toxin FitB
MEPRFLIDTNILIYYFNDHIPANTDKLVDNIFLSSFNISVISKLEFPGWKKFNAIQYRRAEDFLKGNKK